MEIWVRIKTEEQLQAVMESQVNAKRLILDAALFSVTPDCVQMIHRQAADTKVYLQLPDILRQNRKGQIEKLLEQAKGCAGLVIRNLDELGLILEKQMQEQFELIGDAFLYAYNNDALRFYRELIPEMKFIYSDELTDKEAGSLAGGKSVFLYKVYGYQEVMITAQCFLKNTGNCMRSKQAGSKVAQSGWMELRDETKNNLHAESICDLCHTVIYNGVPTSMLDKITDKYENLLYDFTIEDADTVKEILEAKQCHNYTRGHHLTPID